MKTIITLLICAVGITVFGQQKSIVPDTTISWSTLHGNIRLLTGTFPIYTDDNMPAYGPSIEFPPLFERKITVDTLEIKDTAIHFIKIGGEVFEIRRNVELVPVESNRLMGGYIPLPDTGKIHIDTNGIISLHPSTFYVPAINKQQ